jgi:hypothetical protein
VSRSSYKFPVVNTLYYIIMHTNTCLDFVWSEEISSCKYVIIMNLGNWIYINII